MGYIPSVPIAFLMIFITMLCWGSWVNTMKKCGNWRFEAFYVDYAWSCLVWTLLLALLLGGIVHTVWLPLQFIETLTHSTPTGMMFALFAGMVWAIGNMFIVAAIAITGIAVAFPVGIGIAIVFGTFLAFITNPTATHKPIFLFMGLIAVAAASIANGIAYHMKEQTKKRNTYFTKGIFIAVLGGMLLSLYSFPFNFAFQFGLSSYVSAVYFMIGALIATMLCIPILMRKPIIPQQRSIGFSEYTRAKPSWHIWAIIAGMIFSTGLVCNLVVASQPAFSVAIAYALAQCGSMIGALWGICIWKEFKGAPTHAYLYLERCT